MITLDRMARDLGLDLETADLTGGTQAVFSPDRAFRYALTRTWGEGRTVAWVMLNPSTADAFTDDATIRRCRNFSRAAGAFGGLIVVNLFALRATSPAEMRAHPDPVGPRNNDVLARLADGSRGYGIGAWVAAWGAHGAHRGRDRDVEDLLRRCGVTLHCLGLTKDEHPKRPLYLPSNAALRPYPGERAA